MGDAPMGGASGWSSLSLHPAPPHFCPTGCPNDTQSALGTQGSFPRTHGSSVPAESLPPRDGQPLQLLGLSLPSYSHCLFLVLKRQGSCFQEPLDQNDRPSLLRSRQPNTAPLTAAHHRIKPKYSRAHGTHPTRSSGAPAHSTAPSICSPDASAACRSPWLTAGLCVPSPGHLPLLHRSVTHCRIPGAALTVATLLTSGVLSQGPHCPQRPWQSLKTDLLATLGVATGIRWERPRMLLSALRCTGQGSPPPPKTDLSSPKGIRAEAAQARSSSFRRGRKLTLTQRPWLNTSVSRLNMPQPGEDAYLLPRVTCPGTRAHARLPVPQRCPRGPEGGGRARSQGTEPSQAPQ